MTMGRVMFGVGPGILTTDALMMGVDLKETRSMMTEAIEVIMPLLRGEEVTHKGRWFTLNKARVHLLPYTQPHPEVVVASAITPSGGMLAGKHGFGMLCVAATETSGFDVLGENWKIANQIAAEHGRVMNPQQLRLVAPFHIAATREEARAQVKDGLLAWCNYMDRIAPAGMRGLTGHGDPADLLVNGGRAVIGTVEDAITMIERLQAKQGDFGVMLFQAHNWADWDATKKSYELYARFVMPHLAKVNRNRKASFDRLVEDFDSVMEEREQGAQWAFQQWQDHQDKKA
jgi:limonene 1,2-monooxygenase